MFCTKCGNQMADDAHFCGKCGSNILEDDTQLQRCDELASYDDSQPEMVELIIVREKQWFLFNPPVIITIDNTLKYKVDSGEQVIIPLIKGNHMIEFTCTMRNKIIDIQIADQSLLTIKFNRVTGSLEVY